VGGMSLKILKIDEQNDLLIFRTDNPGRPEFVYKKDKFSSFEEAEKEILKSISMEKSRIEKVKAKKDKVMEKKVK